MRRSCAAARTAFASAMAIHAAMATGLRAAGLPEDAIQLVPTRDRAAVGAMLTGSMARSTCIVPRGGKSLVARVQREARVPVFAHLEGIVHVYVDRAADLDNGEAIVAERQDAAHRHLRRRRDAAGRRALRGDASARRSSKLLLDAGCAVRGDAAALDVDAARRAGDRGGLAHRISRRDHRRPRGRRPRRRDRAYRDATARIIPIASSPRTRPRPSVS